MALEDYDHYPNTIARCSECHTHFCVPCAQLLEGEAGTCKTCHGILCPEGYAAAVRERRGECSACSLAKQPEWVPDPTPVPEPSSLCAAGHLLTAENTYEYAGVLRCKECKKVYMRAYNKQYRAERKKSKNLG